MSTVDKDAIYYVIKIFSLDYVANRKLIDFTEVFAFVVFIEWDIESKSNFLKDEHQSRSTAVFTVCRKSYHLKIMHWFQIQMKTPNSQMCQYCMN